MAVMPRCLGAAGSVLIVASPMLQFCAPLVHTFWPVTRQPPSTLTPRVCTDAASEPAFGSLNSWHQVNSPSRLGKTHRWICSADACWVSVSSTQPPMPRVGSSIPASSSSITSCSTAPASRPHGRRQCGTR
jgi:hypothetical protein